MQEHVNSLDEAREWFMSHSDGSVLCVSVDGLEEKECSSFPEAEAFYARF